jgi:hypothetical protein
MSDTGTSVRTLSGSPDVATPHSKFDGQVVPIPYRNVDNIAPAGSINSNVLDMAQWVRLHLMNMENLADFRRVLDKPADAAR